MITVHHWHLPLTPEIVREAKVGDMVYLSGLVVTTAGLPTHQRIVEYIDRGEKIPIDPTNGALLHLASYNQQTDDKFEILYVNPTTSTRFNPYMPKIIRTFGLRVAGGKGGLDAACAKAMQETGCVYLSFVGGASALLSQAIREVHEVAWNDLISHYRLVKVRVENLGPITVGIDAHGNSIYDTLKRSAEDRLGGIMRMLDAERAKSRRPVS